MTDHPYYIYVPSLRGRSAGVRVLLKLGRLLVERGHIVFFAVPSARVKSVCVQNVDIPILDARIILAHRKAGCAPIAVYPEVVVGNPLNAPTVIRYVLNWPGLLGGDASYAPDEIIYGYTEVLCQHVPGARLLHIPVFDTSVFYRHDSGPRNGTCFYAGKYRLCGGVPFGIPDGSVEILREGPGSQTPEEIAGLFRKSEFLYVFEDTLLSLEAALCGCAVIFVPSDIFPVSFGQSQALFAPAILGQADCIENARRNIENMCRFYLGIEGASLIQLQDFAQATQMSASACPNLSACNLVVARPNGTFSPRLALRRLIGVFDLLHPVWSLQVIGCELAKMRIEITRGRPKTLGRIIRLRNVNTHSIRQADLTRQEGQL